MSYVSIVRPNSQDTRMIALNQAGNKLSLVPPAENPLSPTTTTRLQNMRTDYAAKMTAISVAKFAYNGNTPIKVAAENNCRLFTSHFIQVFNLGIVRGRYTVGQRTFFFIPIDSDAVPPIENEPQLLSVSANLLSGDPLRVAAGGAPLENPTIAEVQAARDAYQTAFNNQTTFKDALDVKQEDLEAIEEEADKVIKKVWDELETFYNEEADESRRENCREWGVVYSSFGAEKTITGTILNNGNPASGFKVRLENGRNHNLTAPNGTYELNTTLTAVQKIIIERGTQGDLNYRQWDFNITLTETVNQVFDFDVED